MKRFFKRLAASTVLAAWISPVMAQDTRWDYTATLYLFTPETNIGIGGTQSTLSFSDALDNLDIAFMGSFEAKNGRWGLLADYMMTDLSFGNNTPGPAFSGLNTEMKTRIFNAYATYRVFQNPNVNLDFAAGFRWFSTKTSLTLLPGTAPGGISSVNQNWTDAVIGLRSRFEISDRWSGTVFADYGGFRSGSDTWQVLLTADYEINKNWLARIGYRRISVEREVNGSPFSFEQSGPIIGATYLFLN